MSDDSRRPLSAPTRLTRDTTVSFRRCPECDSLAVPYADGRLYRCAACGFEPAPPAA